MEYKILTGTSKEVEKQLNDLQKDYQFFTIEGMSATNETTTILLSIMNND